MKYFLNNKISTYMLFSALVILGIISLTKLPLSLLPKTTYPGISILIEYPGTSPEKVESIITKPVEKIIKTLPGIEKIESVSEEGQSRININFQLKTDIKISALQAREKIGIIRSYFPKEVQEPVVLRYDPTDKPVIIATVTKENFTLAEIRDYAERTVKPKLQRVDGISEINVVGGAQKEIHINVDNSKFESLKLNFGSLYDLIQNNNMSLPGGTIKTPSTEYNVYTSERYKDVSEIADTTALNAPQGSLIKFYDFSDVKYSWKEQDDYSRYNGKDQVTIYIHQAGEANSLKVCNEIVDILANCKDMKTDIIYNQADYIKSALLNIAVSCIWGSFFICIILYLFFKRIDIVLAIVVSIPISIISTFLFMYFFKLELNIMSLSGLSLGASIIVDNGVVIVTTIFTEKKISRQLIIDKVMFLKNAIIASTLSTLVVFFPIFLSSEHTKQLYQGLALSISIVLLISLFVALILVPTILINTCTQDVVPGKVFSAIKKIKIPYAGKFDGIKEYIFNKVDTFQVNIKNKYSTLLCYALENQLKVFTYILVLLAIAITLTFFIRKDYVDPISTGEFYIYLEFPTGTTLDYTNNAVQIAEKEIQKLKVTDKITTKVEKWRGTVTVKLSSKISSNRAKEKAKKNIKKILDDAIAPYNGFVYMTEADSANARELDITFLGKENDKLRDLAKMSAKKISGIPGIEDTVLRFREGRPEYHLIIDRDKANLAKLTSYEIGNYLRTAVYGPVVSKFIEKDREVDIRMKFLPEQVDSIEKINNFSITNQDGDLIPLRELVTIKEGEGDTKIWRQNGRRSITITAKIGKLSYDTAVKRIGNTLNQVEFPEDYTYSFDDSIKKMEDTRRSMLVSIVLAIVLVFMILASKFESVKVPLIIITTVPLAFIGVIGALFVTRTSLNLSVFIGLIVLIGIVVNNGIILVDSINNEYIKGNLVEENLLEKIKEVCFQRLKPVGITAVTTIFGMMPALIRGGDGSNLWRPLSLTIISGLAFSTILTLIVIPCCCNFVFSRSLKK